MKLLEDILYCTIYLLAMLFNLIFLVAFILTSANMGWSYKGYWLINSIPVVFSIGMALLLVEVVNLFIKRVHKIYVEIKEDKING